MPLHCFVVTDSIPGIGSDSKKQNSLSISYQSQIKKVQ